MTVAQFYKVPKTPYLRTVLSETHTANQAAPL